METRPTNASVADYFAAVPDPKRRADAERVSALMSEITGDEPVMWGTGIVGFGTRRLRYASGRELDWPVVGLAARKAATVVYLMDGYEQRGDLLGRLGPHSIGKSCLYLKKLDAVDLGVLRELIAASVEVTRGAPS